MEGIRTVSGRRRTAYARTQCHAYKYQYANQDKHAHPHSVAYRNSNSNQHSDPHATPLCITNAHAQTDSLPHTDAHGHTNNHPDAHIHTHVHSNTRIDLNSDLKRLVDEMQGNFRRNTSIIRQQRQVGLQTGPAG